MSVPKWIIDTDAGVDDCQALVLALTSPKIEVVGITLVAGNISLPKVIKNAGEVIRIANRPIPYFVGASRPLVSSLVTVEAVHGEDGVNNYWVDHELHPLPPPSSKSAVQALIDLSKEHEGNINLATIGPLTNIALATAIDPDFPKRFNRVVVMGGAVHAKGNMSRVAEFNVFVDPEAAFMVFDRFPAVEMLPWETSINDGHQFGLEFLSDYKSGNSPLGQFIRDITKVEREESWIHYSDPLTLAVCIDPEIVTKSIETDVHVELAGGFTRGMTVVNWGCSDIKESNSLKKRNVKILLDLDIEKIKELLLKSVE